MNLSISSTLRYILIGAVATFAVFSLSSNLYSDSWTPDHDGNGYNNSIERARDIGQLTPAGVNIEEQLGVVPWGFDTSDYYRFAFPNSGITDFQLSVRLEEEPDKSMWINIYDASGQLIYPSIGSDNETFSIPLRGGVYYLEVLTSPAIANGRNLRYTLGAKPVEVPLPDKGGLACNGAPDIGALTSEEKMLDGNLSPEKRLSVYLLNIPYGAAVNGTMRGLAPSERYVVTLTDRLNGNRISFRNSNLKQEQILLDPGFYCLEIASVGDLGLGNYRGIFTANPAGLVPGNSRARAQNIIDMELGNLSENGAYGFVSRYWHYKKPGEIPNVPAIVTHEHDYVIRDWVGTAAPAQYYWFRLPGKSKIDIRVYNQMASARAFVEDEAGNVLASTIVDADSLNPELLPSQSLAKVLPTGEKYYIRVSYTSGSQPGTSFGLRLRASPE